MRSNQWIAVVATVYLASLSLPAFCAEAWSLQSGKFDASSKNERSEIARDLGKKIKTLLQLLPSPSPRESDWLKQEREAIDKIESSDARVARQSQLLRSPELQHERLHAALTTISDALSCAADAKASLSREMMCWSLASFLLTDQSMFNDSVRILKQAGRLPTDLDKKDISLIGPETLGYGFVYNHLGRGIQEYLVIPYLKRTAK